MNHLKHKIEDGIAILGSLCSHVQYGYQVKQCGKTRNPAVDSERCESSCLKVFHQEFCTEIGGDSRNYHSYDNESQC